MHGLQGGALQLPPGPYPRWPLGHVLGRRAVVHGDVRPRRVTGVLVVHVLRDGRTGDDEVLAPGPWDPGHALLHDHLVHVRVALLLRVTLFLYALGHISVDRWQLVVRVERDRLVVRVRDAALLSLVRRHAEQTLVVGAGAADRRAVEHEEVEPVGRAEVLGPTLSERHRDQLVHGDRLRVHDVGLDLAQ